MSMYLFDEQPIIANKTLARALGLNEALVLQQINYWIEINKKSGKNYYDEKYWTYYKSMARKRLRLYEC